MPGSASVSLRNRTFARQRPSTRASRRRRTGSGWSAEFPPLPLDRAGGEPLNQVALDEEEEGAGRDEGKHRGGHHLAPVDREFRNERQQADGEGLLAVAVDQHQGEQQLAPR